MRFSENPLIRKEDIKPSLPDLIVECVLNPGAFRFQDKIWLILRVAERPHQIVGTVSVPIINSIGAMEILTFDQDDPLLDLSDARLVKYDNVTYLSTISHLRLLSSDDGIHFSNPRTIPTILFGQGELETFGIEDCRVCEIDNTYYLTYTQVSENGVGVGLMSTTDCMIFKRLGMILPPHNKDCCLFPEKINNRYVALHRPSGIDIGGNFIWTAYSPDLIHWGDHRCILKTRPGHWDSARVGAGASPILTEDGWLEIFHGADFNHKYSLGAILLEKDDPSQVIYRSLSPLMEPTEHYELNGFFGNVIFTNGHIVDGDELLLYYGASDEVICGAKFSIAQILNDLMQPQNKIN